MSELHRVWLKPKGPLTDLATAQSIFGALCHAMKDHHGEQILETFLSDVFAGKEIFAVSRLLIKDTLPFPMDFLPQEHGNETSALSKDGLHALGKTIKKVRHVSIKAFSLYRNDLQAFEQAMYDLENGQGPLAINEKMRLVYHKDEASIFDGFDYKHYVGTRNKIACDIDDQELFYTSALHFSDAAIMEFYLLCDKARLNQIQEALNANKDLVIGGQVSIGYNNYEFLDIVNGPRYSTKKKMLLSKALVTSGQFHPSTSFYSISRIDSLFTNELASDKLHIPLVVFDEGSIIDTELETIGNIVPEPRLFDGKTIYQYAIGLLI